MAGVACERGGRGAGGKVVFESPVRPSLSTMLESIADKIDPRMWYWGRIDF